MTKPIKEYIRWREDRLLELNEYTTWNEGDAIRAIIDDAYLKGRDARPVVVPIKKEVHQLSLKRKSFEWVCPECGSYKLHEHCGSCGVKLDWSKAKEYKNE